MTFFGWDSASPNRPGPRHAQAYIPDGSLAAEPFPTLRVDFPPTLCQPRHVKYFTKSETVPAFVSGTIARTFDLIAEPLRSVEERIRRQAREFDPSVEGYVAYACQSHGKRLRPSLALLGGGATGRVGSSHLDLAVIIELIHAATLVHDDIMDGAEIRRGQPTANAKWGNSLSVLLGDCLFAHALKLSTGFENAEVSRRIAGAASEVCAGEMIQTQRRFDLKLGVSDYFRIIEMKTAALFATAAELGALLNEAPEPAVAALRNFGLKFGTAYQIYDDCLDIAGSEEKAGKTLGTDLRKGKLTLPILNLLQNADGARHERFCASILRGEPEDAALLATAARREGALASAVCSARNLIADAHTEISILPPGAYTQALAGLCESIVRMLDQFVG
jgi:octaprenyl-diphosphate synthase